MQWQRVGEKFGALPRYIRTQMQRDELPEIDGRKFRLALDCVCSMADLIEQRVFGGNPQRRRSDVVPRSRRSIDKLEVV